MDLKFWKWDITGRKRIERLEKRIAELEMEVGLGGIDDFYSIVSRSMYRSLWGGGEERKPIRLHDKVSRIQGYLNISIQRGGCEVVVKKLKAKS